MISIHLSLWFKFQREYTNLLYPYQEKSEEVLNPVTQQQQNLAQQAKYSTQQQQQLYQYYAGAASGTSSSSVIWQPPPSNGLQSSTQTCLCRGHRMQLGLSGR